MKRSRAQVQKKRSRKIVPTTIFFIPIYILMEILSKLPIFTICNCSGEKGDIRIPGKALPKFKPKCDVPTKELDVLSSCNGLILFHCTWTYGPYVICNPVINEYVIVPQIRKAFYVHCGCGFGFCSGTNQYKVLRFLSPRIGCWSKVEAEIITLGTKLWRRLGEAPRNLRWYSSGCFLNGALHWIALDAEDYFESICCFDLGKERFQPFPVPSEFRGLPGHIRVEVVNLGVLKDDLSLCHRPSNCTLHIWVMKDYAVQESWTKVFVINPLVAPDVHHDYEPLMVLKNGDILTLYASSFMVSFNTRNRSYRKVRVNGIREVIRALKYIPSFVSIKNAATGSNP